MYLENTYIYNISKHRRKVPWYKSRCCQHQSYSALNRFHGIQHFEQYFINFLKLNNWPVSIILLLDWNGTLTSLSEWWWMCWGCKTDTGWFARSHAAMQETTTSWRNGTTGFSTRRFNKEACKVLHLGRKMSWTSTNW